jgi:hypothetical protein
VVQECLLHLLGDPVLDYNMPLPWWWDRDMKWILSRGNHWKTDKSLIIGGQAAVNFFNEHIEDVLTYVDPSKLLVFNVLEGLEPLCKFRIMNISIHLQQMLTMGFS